MLTEFRISITKFRTSQLIRGTVHCIILMSLFLFAPETRLDYFWQAGYWFLNVFISARLIIILQPKPCKTVTTKGIGQIFVIKLRQIGMVRWGDNCASCYEVNITAAKEETLGMGSSYLEECSSHKGFITQTPKCCKIMIWNEVEVDYKTFDDILTWIISDTIAIIIDLPIDWSK